MSNNKSFEKKIKNEQMAFSRITNSQLTCSDCVYRFDDSEICGNTSKCEMYISKPNRVLLDGDCELKREE